MDGPAGNVVYGLLLLAAYALFEIHDMVAGKRVTCGQPRCRLEASVRREASGRRGLRDR